MEAEVETKNSQIRESESQMKSEIRQLELAHRSEIEQVNS